MMLFYHCNAKSTLIIRLTVKVLNDLNCNISSRVFRKDSVVGIDSKSMTKSRIKASWNPPSQDWIKIKMLPKDTQ